jgi:hypothetical protein
MSSALIRKLALATALAAATVVGAAVATGDATAQQTQAIALSVRVVVASGDGSVTDTQLQRFERTFEMQFSRYSSFRLVSEHEFGMVPGQTETISLPNGGGEATFEYVRQQEENSVINVGITGGFTRVHMPPDQPMFIAGPAVEGGTLILIFET